MNRQIVFFQEVGTKSVPFPARQKDASTAESDLESSFVSICGQFSSGRSSNLRSKKNITGDGAFGMDRGENRFWAVATPL